MPSILPSKNMPSADSGQVIEPIEEVRPVVAQTGFRAQIVALARYMMRTEVHTYAFSVAANSILSLFPFIVLLLTITRSVFHSRAMEAIVGDMMKNFLPVGQDFVMRNMQLLAHPQKGAQVFSLVMLLFTSTGVFLPLEVALNNVWGIRENRSYLHNQLVSLGLALAVGLLAMASVAFTSEQKTVLTWVFLGHTQNRFFDVAAFGFLEILRDHRQHHAVLPDLLGTSLSQGAGASCSAYSYRGRIAMGSGKTSVCPRIALAGFPGRIRAVLYFGWVNDVGFSIGFAAVGGGTLLSDTVHAETGARG